MYCITLTSATARMANSYTDIINGTYAVQKVFEMLDYVPLVNEANGANYSITGSIEFRNVVFKYPTSKTITLKNISL
jgi:ABC-type multidrug transport system fused ATPase/permease subunit